MIQYITDTFQATASQASKELDEFKKCTDMIKHCTAVEQKCTDMIKQCTAVEQKCKEANSKFQSKYALYGDLMNFIQTAIGQKPISSVDFSRELEQIDEEWFGVDQYLRESPAKRELIEAILQKAKQNGVKLLWAKTTAQVMDRGYLWYGQGQERKARMLAWLQFKSGIVAKGNVGWARASFLEGKLFGFAEDEIRKWISRYEAKYTEQPYWEKYQAEWKYMNEQPDSFFEFNTFKWFSRDADDFTLSSRNVDFDIELISISNYPTKLEHWRDHILTRIGLIHQHKKKMKTA